VVRGDGENAVHYPVQMIASGAIRVRGTPRAR